MAPLVCREGEEEAGWDKEGEPCRLCRLRFAFDFALHVLPITDKSGPVQHVVPFRAGETM